MTLYPIRYKLKVAGWSVDSGDDPKTELLEVETFASMDTPASYCRVVVYNPPPPKQSLLEQAAGAAASAVGGALGLGGGGGAPPPAFSIQVRGQPVQPGDPLELTLTAGDRSGKVAAAGVQAVDVTFGRTAITALTGMQALAETRLNQVYENQSLKQIVQDLAGQAGVQTGQIDAGDRYPYFVVHESTSLERVCRELARREGLDFYFDADNRLTMTKFQKTSADHTLYYGIDLLDLRTYQRQPSAGQVRVSGESPASREGSEKWHWLAKDVGPFRGEAGKGPRTVALADGALRTKDAAGRRATAHLGALKDQATAGRLALTGNPAIKLGDAVEIKNAPKSELNGLFKVVSVRHVLGKRAGYVTWIGFTGEGGAAEGGGDLLGQLAGAIGL